MKKLTLIKLSIIVILVISVLSGCKKDDANYAGNVQISFKNYSTDLRVYIFPIENTTVPIWSLPVNSSNVLEKTLNVGNYSIQCSGYPNYYEPVGFQIREGETTVIKYDASGHVSVQ
jgi:hypothetical protein